MFGNGNVIINVLILLLVLVRMYLNAAFSNVLVLIHHQCTRTCTHENLLGPRSADIDEKSGGGGWVGGHSIRCLENFSKHILDICQITPFSSWNTTK